MKKQINIEILLALYEKRHILKNLLQLYFHDMSEFDNEEDELILNDDGLYDYKYFDLYYTEQGRFPYLIIADKKIAGFALIRTINEKPLTYEVAEFFVIKKYRNKNLGNMAIQDVFSKHKGHWVIDTPIKNLIAQKFWRKIAEAFDNHTESIIENGKRIQWRFCIE